MHTLGSAWARAMMLASRLLRRALRPQVRAGNLVIIAPDGERLCFGDGTGDAVIARFTDPAAIWAVLLDPDLKTGEMFTQGRLVLDQGSIYDFLVLILQDAAEDETPWTARWIDRIRSLARGFSRNDPEASRRNVSHHYDLDDRLYELFLDPYWQYSCAYFEHPEQTLAQAQVAKMRHVAAKLALRPGDRVLDIGCGWGGLSCFLAETAKASRVHGVTLSAEQLAKAHQRAADQQLSDQVSFALQDYRAVEGRFERIVSVGMFEHVGLPHYAEFFEACKGRLTDDGVMLLHTIGSSDIPSLTNPWLTTHIFPGGHIPSLSEILPVIERTGLVVTDVEVLRLHYAQTLRAWRNSFLARRPEAVALFGEVFCRLWEYYLSMAEAAFRFEDIVVFQLQIARCQTAAPLTRDYIAEGKATFGSPE